MNIEQSKIKTISIVAILLLACVWVLVFFVMKKYPNFNTSEEQSKVSEYAQEEEYVADENAKPLQDEAEQVSEFIKENISSYAPEDPVLGGSWYTTSVMVDYENDIALVFYEDGHIARKAVFEYFFGTGVVNIVSSIRVIEDDEEIFEIGSGQKIAVVLESNPTTGFDWMTEAESEKILKAKEGFLRSDTSESLVGSGGFKYFIFETLEQGEEEVKLSYLRPWESVMPEKTKTIKFIIK